MSVVNQYAVRYFYCFLLHNKKLFLSFISVPLLFLLTFSYCVGVLNFIHSKSEKRSNKNILLLRQ